MTPKETKEAVLARGRELAMADTMVLENHYLFAHGANLEGHLVYQLGHENQDILLTFSENTKETYFGWPLAAQILGIVGEPTIPEYDYEFEQELFKWAKASNDLGWSEDVGHTFQSVYEHGLINGAKHMYEILTKNLGEVSPDPLKADKEFLSFAIRHIPSHEVAKSMDSSSGYSIRVEEMEESMKRLCGKEATNG